MHTPTHAIEAFEKVRSMKKAKLRCEQIFDEDIAKLDYPVRAMVVHANAPEEGQKWLDKLQADHPDISFELSLLWSSNWFPLRTRSPGLSMDARYSKEAVSMKKQTLIKTLLAIAAGI